MSGLELTTGQKVQCGFVLLILAISGFLIVKNSRPLIDGSVNAWTLPVRKHPTDKNKPMGPENPADPKKEETVSVFICAEGQLEVTEFKQDPDKHPTLVFKPETRRGIKVYKYYQDPMAPVAAITDPYRHTLALAAYTVGTTAGKKSLGLLAAAAMTADQLKAEGEARTAMLNALKLVQVSVEEGTFHPDMMATVLNAVATYKARKGDPQLDTVKAEMARTVLEVAAEYMKRVEMEKDVEIDLYIDKIDRLLTAAQKEAVTKAGKQYMDPAHVVAAPAGRGGRGGARNNGNGARSGPAPAVPSRNSPTRGAEAPPPATAPAAGGFGRGAAGPATPPPAAH